MADFLSECLASVLSSDRAKESAAPSYPEIKSGVVLDAKSSPISLAWPCPLENGVVDAVGNTPVLRLSRLEKKLGAKCKLYAKAEFMSVGGSVKDRISKAMIINGEKEGLIKPGDYVIEATSGNTGIGLAVLCAAKGYKMVTVMPDKMSAEKASVLKALGAEVVRTRTSASWHEADSHMSIGYKLRDEINRRAEASGGPRAVVFDQYQNPHNPTAHYENTAQEIVQQLASSPPTHVIIAAGTGGTLTGISKRVKEAWPSVKVIGADPQGSILHKSEWKPEDVGSYEVEGIGYDFHPSVFSKEFVDQWELVGDEEGFTAARNLIATEGILCGGSSGTALAVALRLARTASESDSILVLLPDSIRNYLSKFSSDDWMLLHGWESHIEESSTKEAQEGSPVADSEWNSVRDRAAALASLPVVDFDKATVEKAARACKESKSSHCVVQKQNTDGKYEIRVLSLRRLRHSILKGQNKRPLNELDYRMSVQVFSEFRINTAIAKKYLCAMVQQNIEDPILMIVEAQDASATSPPQDMGVSPVVDGTHASVCIESMQQSNAIKFVTTEAMTASSE